MEGKSKRTEAVKKWRYECILERVVLSIATKLVLTMKTTVLLQNIMNIFDKNERMGQYKQRDNQGVEDGKSRREGGNRKIQKRGKKGKSEMGQNAGKHSRE